MVLQAFVATLLPSQDGTGVWGEYLQSLVQCTNVH